MALSQRNSIRLISQEPYRGRIFDRNNRVLADNILSFDVVIVPQELKDKDTVFARLADILNIDAKEIHGRYSRGYLNPFTPVIIADGISKIQAITIKEEGLDMPGVNVELNSKRYYPLRSTAGHVLGYVAEIDKSRITKLKDYGYDIKDKVGYSGLEEFLDIYLRGEKGGQQIEVDSLGRQVRLLGFKPPERGSDVQIAIDSELQEIADNLLVGKKGAVVIMDIHTGEVLVLSSSPAYDPNVFIESKDKKELNYYLTSPDAPLFNRAISGQFPPASVFKVVTATAALREGKIKKQTSFDCAGRMKIGNRVFKCWYTHGTQDLFSAMANSCDVYFYNVGLIAGPDAISQTAKDYGLSSRTGIDLPNEMSGFVPSRAWRRLSRFQGWYDGDTANFSIGQGELLATPIQLARMMAIVANGGFMVKPHLTKSIAGREIEYKNDKKLNINKKYIDLIRESLRTPVSYETGTASPLNIKELAMCAKTGTAQVAGQEPHGWVAGFFPAKKPRYSFCIFLQNSGSGHYACLLGKELFQEAVKRGKFSEKE